MGFNRLLTDDVVAEMRESYERAPRPHRVMAREYGCSKNVVRKVLLGLSPYDTGHDHAIMRSRHKQSLRRTSSALGKYVCEHPDPLVKRLFDLINRERVLMTDLTERAGLGRDVVRAWGRAKKTPTVGPFQAALQVLGYRLIVVRDDPESRMTPEENAIYQKGYRSGYLAGQRHNQDDEEDAA